MSSESQKKHLGGIQTKKNEERRIIKEAWRSDSGISSFDTITSYCQFKACLLCDHHWQPVIFWDWIRLLRTTYRGLSQFPSDGWTYARFENMHIYIEKISSWPTSCCRLVSKQEKGSLYFWYHAYWLSSS